MAQKLLNGTKIRPVIQEMGGKCMPQHVGMNLPRQRAPFDHLVEEVRDPR